MLKEFRTDSALEGEGCRIRVEWNSLSPSRPELLLLRRRRSYPVSRGDGDETLRLSRLLPYPELRAAVLERSLFLGPGMVPESTLFEASYTLLRKPPAGEEKGDPLRAEIFYYDAVNGTEESLLLEELTRVEYRTEESPDLRLERHTLYGTPGGGAERLLARVEISFDPLSPEGENHRFLFQLAGGEEVSIPFRTHTSLTLRGVLEESYDPDLGEVRRVLELHESGLEPGEVYYYRLFLEDPPASDRFLDDRLWRSRMRATGRYGSGDYLYGALPAFYRNYDEPDPAVRGKGDLRNFLSLLGHGIDQLRGYNEGLASRFDTLRTESSRLPLLSHWIGWEYDNTLHESQQRYDLLFAPTVYSTLGTVPNLRALVNRITGWDCEIKEFVHNVFLTNAPESIRLWEIFSSTLQPDESWSEPQVLWRTEGYDGGAAPLTLEGDTVLLFHSDRDGEREIWTGREGEAPRPVRSEDVSPVPSAWWGENPAVLREGAGYWLFWNTTGPSGRNIQYRRVENSIVGEAAFLTDHPEDDLSPSVVKRGPQLWLFFQSRRRGRYDVWARVRESDEWGPPHRITTSEYGHYGPSAALDDAGRVWLVYGDDRGDTMNLLLQVYDGVSWGEPVEVAAGNRREESPSVVFYEGSIWIFWSAQRKVAWQVRGRKWGWTAGEPAPLGDSFAVTRESTDDKEPSAFVDGSGRLRLYWRSRRNGRLFQSRTVDTNDPGMLGRMGTIRDRAHYTYDTGKTDRDYYARDVVGIYLTPDTEQSDVVERNRRLFDGPLKKFIPINVRPVLFILPAIHREYVYTYDFPEVDPQRLIGEKHSRQTESLTDEIYEGVTDSYGDTMTGWIWLRSWSALHPDHRTIDTGETPLQMPWRTWHTGVTPGGE